MGSFARSRRSFVDRMSAETFAREPSPRGLFLPRISATLSDVKTGFSRMSKSRVKEEIRRMREYVRGAAASPESARALLVRAGILEKAGHRLSRAYR